MQSQQHHIPPIITMKQAREMLVCKDGNIRISLDLGMSAEEVGISRDNAIVRGQSIPIAVLKKVKKDSCYIIEDGTIRKLAFFSDETNLYYKLVPTSDWPTFTLSSTPMHRHSKMSPKQDTETKINALSRIKGNVLDTCCGMGYTAIMSSKAADRVFTFEKDRYVLALARLNPYSRMLFSSSKIKLMECDVFQGITSFRHGFFDAVIHDPPTLAYSPVLYSKDFYIKLYRVMKPLARIYHYCPWPSKSKGREFYKGILKRLRECGFTNAKYDENSSGIIAARP